MEEHRRRVKRHQLPHFFLRQHDCMVHGKAMSSLSIATSGARPSPQSPQLATKESTMEKHGKAEGAVGWLRTRRKGPPASLKYYIVI